MRVLLSAVAGGLVIAGLAFVAEGGGYAKTYPVPANGVVSVVNGQANSVWRPTVVAVVLTNAASCTIEVSRVVGDLVYPVTIEAGTAQAFVYEFSGSYWCGVSNGVRVTVAPACTGTVEVIYE